MLLKLSWWNAIKNGFSRTHTSRFAPHLSWLRVSPLCEYGKRHWQKIQKNISKSVKGVCWVSNLCAFWGHLYLTLYKCSRCYYFTSMNKRASSLKWENEGVRDCTNYENKMAACRKWDECEGAGGWSGWDCAEDMNQHIDSNDSVIMYVKRSDCGVVMFSVASVCVSVCLQSSNFRQPWHRKFIFSAQVRLHNLQIKIVYEGHRIKVKVTVAKTFSSWYCILAGVRQGRWSLIPSMFVGGLAVFDWKTILF